MRVAAADDRVPIWYGKRFDCDSRRGVGCQFAVAHGYTYIAGARRAAFRTEYDRRLLCGKLLAV